MKQTLKQFKRVLAIGLGVFIGYPYAGAVDPVPLLPTQLHELMDTTPGLMLIDMRSTAEYQLGSIPGAVNIAAPFVAARNYPVVPAIVLFGDGLGSIADQRIADQLAARSTVPIYVLTGGYAAWQDSRQPDTAIRGMQPERLARIHYAQLTSAELHDAVIYDVRAVAEGMAPASTDDPVARFAVDLGVALRRVDPGRMEAELSTDNGRLLPMSAASEIRPLIILVDDNDGRSELAMRRLRGLGQHRVVILTGGAEIIRHQGRTGLLRRSTGLQFETDANLIP